MIAFHLSDNGSGVRVTYDFLRPHVKSEEFKGLDSTSLALPVLREEKSDRNHYDRTAPSGQELGGMYGRQENIHQNQKMRIDNKT